MWFWQRRHENWRARRLAYWTGELVFVKSQIQQLTNENVALAMDQSGPTIARTARSESRNENHKVLRGYRKEKGTLEKKIARYQ
jgi:hypothetical protein